jgi:hypothetical protein
MTVTIVMTFELNFYVLPTEVYSSWLSRFFLFSIARKCIFRARPVNFELEFGVLQYKVQFSGVPKRTSATQYPEYKKL